MAIYRTSKPTFWTDDYISVLPANGKLLYLFLMNNSFAMDNNLGITQATAQMIACVVGITAEEVEELLLRFETDKKIVRDGNKILLLNFIRHQCSSSPKIATMLNGEYDKLTSEIIKYTLSVHYPQIFKDKDTPLIPYPYPTDTLSIHKEQGTCTGYKEQETERGDETSPRISQSSKAPPCPYTEIVQLYNEILPERPACRTLNPTRKRQLFGIWRSSEKWQDLQKWRDFFGYIRKSDFLMGRAASNGYTNNFDLEWYTSPKHFDRIREGIYHNSGKKQERSG